MQIDDFIALARKRRSIRQFKPDPVPDEYINKIIEAARWAMSGANSQPWEFIVVKDKDIISKLADIHLKYYQIQTIVELTRIPEYGHPTQKKPTDILWRYAPVVIAVLGDMRVMQASTITLRFFEEHTFDHNMANCVQMMHLAAAALGLGSQWVSMHAPRKELMKAVLGVPPDINLFNLVPIGYPAHKPAGFRRKLSEIVHQNKYDMSRFRTQEDIQEFVKFLRTEEKKLVTFPIV